MFHLFIQLYPTSCCLPPHGRAFQLNQCLELIRSMKYPRPWISQSNSYHNCEGDANDMCPDITTFFQTVTLLVCICSQQICNESSRHHFLYLYLSILPQIPKDDNSFISQDSETCGPPQKIARQPCTKSFPYESGF